MIYDSGKKTEALWEIADFAKAANEALAQSGSLSAGDERQKQELTERNLRRLVTEGAIDPPERVGRQAFYGPKHLEQVLAARELMSKGFSVAAVRAVRQTADQDEPPAAPEPAAGALPSAAAVNFLDGLLGSSGQGAFPESASWGSSGGSMAPRGFAGSGLVGQSLANSSPAHALLKNAASPQGGARALYAASPQKAPLQGPESVPAGRAGGAPRRAEVWVEAEAFEGAWVRISGEAARAAASMPAQERARLLELAFEAALRAAGGSQGI